MDSHEPPSRSEFFRDSVITCAAPPGTQCSICTDDCKETEEVVKILHGSTCIFHKECIMSWFYSTHRMRNTCPNDRALLYESERLTPKQIDADSESGTFMSTTSIDQQILETTVARLGIFLFKMHNTVEHSDVVSSWHSAADLINRLEDDVRFLRGARASPNPPREEMQTRFELLAEEIEEELSQARGMYANAAKQELEELFESLLDRLETIRETSVNQPQIIAQYEAHVRDLVYQYNCGNVEDYRRLLRLANWTSQQVNCLGMKLCSQLEPDIDPDHVEHPGLSEEEVLIFEVGLSMVEDVEEEQAVL